MRRLGEHISESAWEDIASRLGTGRSGSAVAYHWGEERKKLKLANELRERLQEEAEEERAEASTPRVSCPTASAACCQSRAIRLTPAGSVTGVCNCS